MKHGRRARLSLLPGEDGDALQERLDLWLGELKPATDAERVLIENAVHASWREQRARDAETDDVSGQMLEHAERYDDRQAEEVARLAGSLADDPMGTVNQLRQTVMGCEYLRDQWLALGARLGGWTGLMAMQRRLAIHLLGKRMEDLFAEDALVRQWMLALLGGIYGNVDVDRAHVYNLLLDDTPDEMSVAELEHRVGLLVAALPAKAAAQALQRTYVAAMVAELEERRELVALRDHRDRRIALGRMTIDTGAEGMARHRYEQAQERSCRARLRELRALQGFRRSQESEEGDAPPTSDVVTAEAVVPPGATNEPTAAIDIPPSAGATNEPTAADSPEQAAAATNEPTATTVGESAVGATNEPTAANEPGPAAGATNEPTATLEVGPTADATNEPTATTDPKPTADATNEPTATTDPRPAAEVETAVEARADAVGMADSPAPAGGPLVKDVMSFDRGATAPREAPGATNEPKSATTAGYVTVFAAGAPDLSRTSEAAARGAPVAVASSA